MISSQQGFTVRGEQRMGPFPKQKNIYLNQYLHEKSKLTRMNKMMLKKSARKTNIDE